MHILKNAQSICETPVGHVVCVSHLPQASICYLKEKKHQSVNTAFDSSSTKVLYFNLVARSLGSVLPASVVYGLNLKAAAKTLSPRCSAAHFY